MKLFTCDRCGMQWTDRMVHWDGRDLGLRPPHACPEPYDPETARSLLDLYVQTGTPVHPAEKARIRLGLEARS